MTKRIDGVLHKPGTPGGPCANRCVHNECTEIKRLAKEKCTLCGKPLGFTRRVFRDRKNQKLFHTTCADRQGR